MPNDKKATWTTIEMARHLGLTVPVVRYLAATGLIPVIKIHKKCWRYDPEEVSAAVRERGLLPRRAS